MDHVIKATFNSNAKLAKGQEKGSKISGKSFHDVFASNAAVGRAHANGPKLGRVIGVFVEGHKVVSREEGSQDWRDLVVEDQGENLKEDIEVGAGISVARAVKGKSFECISKVSKGACCCTLLEVLEGSLEGLRVHCDGGSVCVAGVVV